jgi:hypothetical protein
MKKFYDITFTVSISEEAFERLFDVEYIARRDNEDAPLWSAGLDMVGFLEDFYGVEVRLKKWRLKRNAKDREKKGL